MELFELLIGLLVAAALLTTLAGRAGMPYPVLLALAGTALALLPTDKIAVRIDPQLALALFVAPVLLSAGFDTSLRDLRANWVPIFSLVLFCVVVTVAAVAAVAHWLVPDMPWAVAVALGAIVAPPDATAATAVLRFVAPPHRMLVILEGESLLNDASALLIYRLAVAAAAGQAVTPGAVAPELLLSAGGGCLIGFALGRIVPWLLRRVDDDPVHVVLQFAGTFAVWIIGERVGASPILTVVVYAMTLARSPQLDQDAHNRRMSFAVWDVAIYALNGLAFILIGLQLHPILAAAGSDTRLYVTFPLAILGTVLLARIGWVTIYNRGWSLHRRVQGWRGRSPEGGPSLGASLVVSWCGMRGVVTLATALALPYDFPHRDLLVTAAFTVVLGTLLLQGLTLKPLLRVLDLHDNGEVGREERLARREATLAALRMLKRRREPEATALRKEYEVRIEEITAEAATKSGTINALREEAIATQRRVLDKLRRNHTIGDHAFHTVEEELDWAEGHVAGRKRGGNDDPTDDGAPEEGSQWH